MKKILFLLSILCISAGAFAQNETVAVKVLRGAALYVYEMDYNNARPAPNAVPFMTVIDLCNNFSSRNICYSKGGKNVIPNKIFSVWKGYITIPAKGEYVLNMRYRNMKYGYCRDCTILQINGKDYLQISHASGIYRNAHNCALEWEPGEYEITLIHRAESNDADFILELWDKKAPLKKVKIYPAMLWHGN